ncbi:hypothetical protein K3495_g2781 [Podosphaera aphanis]|nr:hypothetical protein K3495_g2781 [Podosphaera aphanis]
MLRSALVAAVMWAVGTAASAMDSPLVEYTTEVLTAYTTICPNATQIIFDQVTYTATESTTLTITNCPCTVIKPIYTTSSVYCDTCSVPTPAAYSNSTGAHAQPTKNTGIIPNMTPTTAMPSQTKIASSGAKVLTFTSASRTTLLVGMLVYFL